MEDKRPTKYVRALYNFERKHTDELSFKKDDIITVTQQFEGGWWEGTRDGRTGWFPSNYVVPVDESARPNIRDQEDVMNTSAQSAEPEEEHVDSEKIKECQNVILLHMIEGEKNYINEITNLINSFFKPLQIFIEKLPNKKKISEIRATLESIFALQKNILSTLEDLHNRSDGASYLRIGAVFMNFAPTIGDLYETYASLHPYVVATLEKEKDLIKSLFDMSNFTFILKNTKAQLRLPFDRLDKYPGLMIDLERYIEESHPDRGDIQRAVLVLKELSDNCTSIRKNKETELDILCGKIIGWQGERLSSLGDPALTLRVRHEMAGDCVMMAFPSWIFILSLTEQVDVYRLQEKISIEGLVVESGGDDNSLLVLHCSHLSESLSLECVDGVTRDKAVTALQQLLPRDTMLSSAMSPKHVVLRQTQHEPMTCLRPAPPLVPKFGSVPRSNSPKSNKLTRKKSDRQKSIEELDRSIFRKPDPSGSMLEDAMILQVIESYCASSRARNTLDLAKLRLSDSEVRIGACLGAAGGIISAKHTITPNPLAGTGISGVQGRQLAAVAAASTARDSSDSSASSAGAAANMQGGSGGPVPVSAPTVPVAAPSATGDNFLNSFGLPLPTSAAQVAAAGGHTVGTSANIPVGAVPTAAAAAAAQRSYSFTRPGVAMPQAMPSGRLPQGARGSGRGASVGGPSRKT